MVRRAGAGRLGWALGVVVALVMALVGAQATAAAAPATASGQGNAYARTDQPGPALSVPTAKLNSALDCSANLTTSSREPVLLIPGTSTSPEASFSWNFLPAFKAKGVPYCTVTTPEHNDGDIQVSAEYVVHAIRTMHARTGEKVQLLGWSQGAGPLPRWALRWWPDTHSMVDGLIGIDPDNHGTLLTNLAFGCGLPVSLCAPAIWQQRIGSQFLTALNSRAETFPGINYTVIYSRIDDIVVPDLGGYSAALPPGPNVRNIALADVCPSALATTDDHGLVLGSPITYALAMDALHHPGHPADPARVSRSVCHQLGTKYANPITQALGIAKVYGGAFLAHLPSEGVPAAPPLKCYVYSKTHKPARCTDQPRA